MKKVNGKSASEFASVRVKAESKNKADSILSLANKKKFGRKIKLHDLFEFSLTLLTDEHIALLQDKALSNEDRKELLRQKYIELRGSITKDEFTGFMMKPEFLDFVRDTKIQPELH